MIEIRCYLRYNLRESSVIIIIHIYQNRMRGRLWSSHHPSLLIRLWANQFVLKSAFQILSFQFLCRASNRWGLKKNERINEMIYGGGISEVELLICSSTMLIQSRVCIRARFRCSSFCCLFSDVFVAIAGCSSSNFTRSFSWRFISIMLFQYLLNLSGFDEWSVLYRNSLLCLWYSWSLFDDLSMSSTIMISLMSIDSVLFHVFHVNAEVLYHDRIYCCSNPDWWFFGDEICEAFWGLWFWSFFFPYRLFIWFIQIRAWSMKCK